MPTQTRNVELLAAQIFAGFAANPSVRPADLLNLEMIAIRAAQKMVQSLASVNSFKDAELEVSKVEEVFK